MIHVLYYTVFHCSGDTDKIEHGKVLHIFAQANPACVGPNGSPV